MTTPIPLVPCPRCRREIAMKTPRPGRFRVACPSCGEAFAIRIDEGPDGSPVVELLGPTLGQDRAEAVTRDMPAPALDEAVEGRPTASASLEPEFQPPRSLGGYRVGRKVGATRSGAVFEGLRRANGRRVALAVVKPRWAADARFVSRLAREAFATGQLAHPNLAAPEDFDVDRGFPFAASGAVEGLPLSDPSGREGLDRNARVSAILHAARGLRLAHEQGVYHRDISPAKIRVDPASGLVRLADVGVNLTPDTPEGPHVAPIPLANVPGAPPAPNPVAPPEPPSASFAREDVAGLGRSLKALLGGGQGERALTPGLAAIVRRMTGEQPGERFPDLGAVIRALEAELGLEAGFAPREEEAAELENCARGFDSAPLANIRPMLTLGSVAVFGAFALFAALVRQPLTAVGVVAFSAVVGASMVVLRGVAGRDPIFDRAREWLLGGGRNDLLTAVAAVALVGLVLTVTGLLGKWVFLGMVAVGLASAFHFAVDRPIAQARVESVDRARALIRGLRRIGVEEDAIRRFACRQAGRNWEEFFESLFGYEALRSARGRWGRDAGGARRPRFAPWRDPIVDAIDARLEGRRMARDRALFQGIEERNLEARGVNLLTARRKAHRVAEALVLTARRFRKLADEGTLGIPLMDAFGQVALRPDDFLTTTYSDDREPPAWRERLADLGRALFGSRVRFLAGSVFLAGGLFWMHQNEIIDAERIRKAAEVATTDREKAVDYAEAIGRDALKKVQDVADSKAGTKQLQVEGISRTITDRVDGFGLGVAALILLASSSFRGAKFSLFALPGALIAAFGPRLIDPNAPTLGTTSLLAMAVGGGLFALGLFFGRARD